MNPRKIGGCVGSPSILVVIEGECLRSFAEIYHFVTLTTGLVVYVHNWIWLLSLRVDGSAETSSSRTCVACFRGRLGEMTEFEKVGVLSDRASDNVQLDSDKDNEDSQSSLQPVLGKGEPTMSKSTGLADSWDMIETPRTARTDSDIAPTEVKVAESFPPKGIESQGLPSAKKQYKKYARKEKKHGSTHPARSRHARKAVEDRSDETHGRQHRSGMHSDFSKSENDLRTSNCNENKPPRARPRSANSSHRDIPRASRRMKIRTHEDMLQEHYAELSVLLNDQANLSREKLREHHYVQTKRMMEDYKELNNGMSPRGILVSRSLPESLRSPRSHSNTPRGEYKAANQY